MEQVAVSDVLDRRGSVQIRSKSAVPGTRPRVPEALTYRRLEFQGVLAALIAADLIGSVCLGMLIFAAHPDRPNPGREQLWAGIAGFAIAWCLSSHSQALYRRASLVPGLRRLLIRALSTCALTFGLMLLVSFALKMTGGISRLWLLSWAACVVVWICATRLLWRGYLWRLLDRGGCLESALVLAGSQPAARRIAASVERESGGHIRVAASTSLPGIADGAPLEWVEQVVREGVVDRIIVGHFEQAMPETNLLLARLARVAVDVTLIPNIDGLRAPVLTVDRIGSLPAIDLDSRPLTRPQAAIKRAEDLILASILLALFAPVLLLISIAIKLDSPGPVFFRQLRAGLHDRSFSVWKFRTMRDNARDEHSVRQTSRDDIRVTAVGHILRRTSLDELPQLFNVIGGTMSIVGPRPHALGMTAVGRPLVEVLDEYSARHRLKPGITGWAQVNGCRGEVDSEDKLRRRVALDCYYIENWSLSLDAWIILRTAALILFDPNAY